MENFTTIQVSSSNISEIGYDAVSYTLRIWFVNNTVYDYHNVPYIEYEALSYAPSVGSYLNRNIKGAYNFSKVS